MAQKNSNSKKGTPSLKKEHIILIIIFLLVLGIRLFFSLNSGFDYEAYDTLRQSEQIMHTGLPLYDDPLSYSGRTVVFPPLFYYLIALAGFIIPLSLAAKIIPCIAFSSMVIIIYLIARHITKNKAASLTAAFFAGFVPIIYSVLNQASVLSLTLPLIFLLSYCLIRVEEKGYASAAIILTVLLLLTNASVMLVLLSFIIYFIIIRLAGQKPASKETETGFFLFFLALWFNLLLFKKAFFTHGISFIWQNIPSAILSSYFQELSFLGAIYAVGVIPLLLGVYAAYHLFFRAYSRAASFYVSFALVSFLMLWLKLIPFRTGILFLSLNLVVLSAYSLKIIIVSLSKTKLPRLSGIFTAVIILLFVLTTATPLIPNIMVDKPPETDIQALEWIKNNTPEDSVVQARPEEGFLISYIAERKNIIDHNFLFVKNIDQRYDDVTSLYRLRFKPEAIRLLNNYGVDYIFFSEKTQQMLNASELYYVGEECFEKVYENKTIVYEFLECRLE